MPLEKAKADPTKEFFIRMLTRDISVADCVLDLLDNSVDGARSNMQNNGENRLSGSYVHLRLGSDTFEIEDNCGGIGLDNAKEYAFNFGRRTDAPRISHESIGIYGIGMKRALFKLGKQIDIASSTQEDSFRTTIDVQAWEEKDKWEFDLVPGVPTHPAGTKITVRRLNPEIGEELVDSVFQSQLSRYISRGYAIFMRDGLEITVDSVPIHPEYFRLLVGREFAPVRTSYEDEGVRVEITAGMASPPPQDHSAEIKIPHYRTYGWYVVCNDRVVLSGDKTDRTVWGTDGFNAWHNQYNGFLGVAAFHSIENPAALPWRTTKRDLDLSHPLYRRAIARMKEATKPYLEYTNARKDQEERLAQVEKSAKPVLIEQIELRNEMVVPKVDPPRVKMGNVLYRKPRAELRKAAIALGNRNMTYKAIGKRTFEYYLRHEVEDNVNGS